MADENKMMREIASQICDAKLEPINKIVKDLKNNNSMFNLIISEFLGSGFVENKHINNLLSVVNNNGRNISSSLLKHPLYYIVLMNNQCNISDSTIKSMLDVNMETLNVADRNALYYMNDIKNNDLINKKISDLSISRSDGTLSTVP